MPFWSSFQSRDRRKSYLNAVHTSGLGQYAELSITTYNQMELEMVNLFWPLVARSAGFERPYQPPTLLINTLPIAPICMENHRA